MPIDNGVKDLDVIVSHYTLTVLIGAKVDDATRLKAIEKRLLDLATSHRLEMLAAE